MALLPSNKKTLIRGSGDLPFDMEIANVQVDLKQDETKIVLGIDHPFSRSEFEFPIHYPNGTPDEMSDRETKLREEIAALEVVNAGLGQQLGQAMANKHPPKFFPLQRSLTVTDGNWYLVCVSDKPSNLVKWKVRKFVDGSAYDRDGVECGSVGDYAYVYQIVNPNLLEILNDTSPSSLGKCKELEAEIGRLKQLNSRLQDDAKQQTVQFQQTMKGMEDDYSRLSKQFNLACETRDQALGERDLYKSQLDVLHAKYEAQVAQNLVLQSNRDSATRCLIRSGSEMASARNYLGKQG